jgi:hypothetical protein
MVDYTGQRRTLVISAVVLSLSVPISIILAFILDNYLYALYFCVAVTLLLMVVFGPNWPYLNLNRPAWRPDSEAPTPEQHRTVIEERAPVTRKRGPRR